MYWSLMGVKGLTTQRKSFVKNHNNLSIIIQKSFTMVLLQNEGCTCTHWSQLFIQGLTETVVLCK